MITKWIVGATWISGRDSYPELQIWRSSGNDMYQKINGTLLAIDIESKDHVYEYDNFAPIPVQAGDILGVFVPQNGDGKLILQAESEHMVPLTGA